MTKKADIDDDDSDVMWKCENVKWLLSDQSVLLVLILHEIVMKKIQLLWLTIEVLWLLTPNPSDYSVLMMTVIERLIFYSIYQLGSGEAVLTDTIGIGIGNHLLTSDGWLLLIFIVDSVTDYCWSTVFDDFDPIVICIIIDIV